MVNFNTVIVSKHAVDRFRDRTRCKRDDEYVRSKIREMLSSDSAVPVQLKKNYRVNHALQNNPNNAFRKFNDWVFVIDESKSLVVTCYSAGALRWEYTEPQGSRRN